MAKPKRFDSCQTMRRVLIKKGTLNMGTGKTEMTGQERVDQPCGTPLFSDQERTTGQCRSCRDGWTHPDNHPI